MSCVTSCTVDVRQMPRRRDTYGEPTPAITYASCRERSTEIKGTPTPPTILPFYTLPSLHGLQTGKMKSQGLGASSQTLMKRKQPRYAARGLLTSPEGEDEGLTSRISLLAFGDVFSLNTLMATGIFTFSPSGIQMPWNRKKRT